MLLRFENQNKTNKQNENDKSSCHVGLLRIGMMQTRPRITSLYSDSDYTPIVTLAKALSRLEDEQQIEMNYSLAFVVIDNSYCIVCLIAHGTGNCATDFGYVFCM